MWCNTGEGKRRESMFNGEILKGMDEERDQVVKYKSSEFTSANEWDNIKTIPIAYFVSQIEVLNKKLEDNDFFQRNDGVTVYTLWCTTEVVVLRA